MCVCARALKVHEECTAENNIQKRASDEAKHENVTEVGQVPSVFIRVTSAIHQKY